jgi:hypothetical protein
MKDVMIFARQTHQIYFFFICFPQTFPDKDLVYIIVSVCKNSDWIFFSSRQFGATLDMFMFCLIYMYIHTGMYEHIYLINEKVKFIIYHNNYKMYFSCINICSKHHFIYGMQKKNIINTNVCFQF